MTVATGHMHSSNSAEAGLLAATRALLDDWACRGEGALERTLSHLTPDIALIGTGADEVAVGVEAVTAFLRREHDNVPDPFTYVLSDAQAHLLNAAAGLVHGDLTLHVPQSNGEHLTVAYRLTCALRDDGTGWRVALWQASRPDPEQAEGESLPIDALRARNQELEQLVAERTAEIEAARREAEIEAALERVRARAMGMQKSDELQDVIRVVRDQIASLEIHADHAGFIMDYRNREDMHIWLADENEVPTEVFIPYFDSPHWNSFREAQASGENRFVNQLDFKTKNRFYSDLFDLIPGVPDEAREFYLGCPGLSISTVLLDDVGLYIENFAARPYTDDENRTLMRFGKVFQQAYTRFLDLQRAEAQAREAQIETALERVRSRTMAMQSSDELSETSALLFAQIKELGIETWSSGFNLLEEDGRACIGYNATPAGGIGVPIRLPLTEDPFFQTIYEARERGDAFVVFESGGESLAETYRYMFTLPVVKDVMQGIVDEGYALPTYQVTHCGFFSHGHLMFITLEPVPEAHDIFRRFTAVFEQTYTRYLDLKRAEAQAREAQIEAALERVRSRAMGMRSSDELREMVLVILKEMKALAFPSGRCTLVLFDRETGDADFWMSGVTDDDLPERYHVSYHDLPTYKALHEGWQRGTPFFEVELAGEVKREQDRFFHEETEFSRLPEPAKEGMRSFGDIWLSNAATTHGVVQAVGPEPLSEENAAILQRFAKVIDLTYTRVDDIQQSEAQVREAQIEAALERLRSRTMAMRSSDELGAISFELVQQVRALGVEMWHCAFNVFDEDEERSTEWGANADGYYPTYHTPRVGIFRRYYEIAQTGRDLHVEEIGEDRCADHYEALCALPGVGEQLLKVKDAGIPFPTSQVDHVAYFKYGYLIFVTYEPAPEAHDIFRRFAKVFEQTYTRFLDLQQAEARSREAEIEAALERVRSRALAMTTSDELLDVIVKIHHEYAGLGLPCEVFWQTRYTPESYHKAVTSVGGKKVSDIMELPRDFTMLPELVAWERSDEKIGVFMFDAEAAAQYVHHMNTKGHFHQVDPEGITPEIARELGGLTFVQARTSHGEIGYALWGETEPSEEAKDVLVRFATAFDLAYRRFEDLQQAEADHQAILEEKALTEQTLDELRATQAQLVQSEKLASLGALTAGIAHEIKNPLNFVTNFAGLTRELAAELAEELAGDADPEEVAAILEDLQINAAKIEEHGQRADAIVKSMMAHARTGGGQRETVDLNALVEEHVNLAWHGRRARVPGFDVALERDYDAAIGSVELVPQEIGRVVINLVDNAFDAVHEHAAGQDGQYVPQVTVATRQVPGGVEIRVADNGPGMSGEVKSKVFEPFFTTKPTGSGTGLGLSMSHDIVAQGHGGDLRVESASGEGATFTLTLPVSQSSVVTP